MLTSLPALGRAAHVRAFHRPRRKAVLLGLAVFGKTKSGKLSGFSARRSRIKKRATSSLISRTLEQSRNLLALW
jgi:hypothetical protein